MKRLDRWLWALVAALALSFPATVSQAGCGCDHPPPVFAPVMPAFGSPGAPLVLNLETPSLSEGAGYYVEFYNEKTMIPVYAKGIASAADSLQVETPSTIVTGPTRIRILDDRFKQVAKFNDSLFTGLPLPRAMPSGDSMVLIEGFYGAVSRDGVLYIPVDMRNVLDGTQFAFVMADTPIEFELEDVVFYNRQGVDLTLFTLAVDDPTVREWGSYYGWDVDQDAGIVGTVYEAKVGESPAPGVQSDMLTYWRHEFHTYAEAHAPGNSHEVDADGYHRDGTWHVDHDSLVIAIRGKLDQKKLSGSHIEMNLVVTTAGSEGPIESAEMAEKAYGSALYVETDAALSGYVAGIMGAEMITPESDGVVASGDKLAAESLEPVAVVEEPVEVVEELAPVADVQIARAVYNDKKEKLIVFATAGDEHGGDLELTLSVQGFVSNAPMSWNDTKARYEYRMKSPDDLNGRLAVVSLPGGANVSQVIQ